MPLPGWTIQTNGLAFICIIKHDGAGRHEIGSEACSHGLTLCALSLLGSTLLQPTLLLEVIMLSSIRYLLDGFSLL